MEDNEAAQQHWLESIAAQRTLMGISDCAGQFREPAFSGLLRQAWRAYSGQSDDGIQYLTVPF
jgi:hypothetical protein